MLAMMASEHIMIIFKENKIMQPILIEKNHPHDPAGVGGRKVRSTVFNLAESPLSWLRARRLVSDRQFVAGEMLRVDYERAGLPQRVTMAWDAPPAGKVARGAPGYGASTLAAIDAKRRFDGAISAAGNGLADILWRVVCAGEPLPGAERALGWPARAGRIILTLALDRIADYYRVE